MKGYYGRKDVDELLWVPETFYIITHGDKMYFSYDLLEIQALDELMSKSDEGAAVSERLGIYSFEISNRVIKEFNELCLGKGNEADIINKAMEIFHQAVYEEADK